MSNVIWRDDKIDTEQNKIKNRIGITIFVLLFFSYCYFLQNPRNANTLPRIALGISLIENGSLNINKFHKNTHDKAYYKGNYYSDKAPGLAFSAIPAIAASKLYLDSAKGDYKWLKQEGGISSAFVFVTQFATIATSGFMTALAALALYFVAIRWGAGLGGATFGALAYGLATPAWGWATFFFGHASAAACLFLGLVSIMYLLDLPSAKRRDVVLGFVSGALLSWAVVIEYATAPASAVIAIYGLASALRWERGRFIRVFLSAFAGAVLFILPLLIYHYAAYENIFTSGYGYTVFHPGQKEGFYGIRLPGVGVLVRLLVGIQKGILWFSPLLLFVPLALYKLWKTPGKKGLVITIIAVSSYYFLMNSGYAYWTGGGSTGPRHITPILPFICLPLAFLWTKAGKKLKLGLLIFFAISFLISLMSVSVSMQIGYSWHRTHLVTEYIIPKFIEASQLKTSLIVRLISPSYIGNSHLDLLPLYIVLALGGLYILWELKNFQRKSSNPTS